MSDDREFIFPDIHPARWEYPNEEEYQKASEEYREEYIKVYKEYWQYRSEIRAEKEQKNKNREGPMELSKKLPGRLT